MSAFTTLLTTTDPATLDARQPEYAAGGGIRVVASQAPQRLKELDALRGLAAMTVVLCHFHGLWHFKLMNWTNQSFPIRLLDIALHPLYAGAEAVMLFFVLSGFVLALPFERGRAQSYPVFLTRRVTRIYLPYLGALALAVVCNLIWHGALPNDEVHHVPDIRLLLQHIGLIGVFNASLIDPPVWSLVHEMRISLIFPLLWLATRKLRVAGSVTLIALFTVVAGWAAVRHRQNGPTGWYTTLEFMSYFVVGILLARYYRIIVTKTHRFGVAIFIFSFFLYGYNYYILVRLLPASMAQTIDPMIYDWATVLGAAGLIVSAIARPEIMLHHVSQFLGRISYSLYLLHLPILWALTLAFKGLSPWLQFPLDLSVSVGLATLYCRWVEEPVTRWGRSLRFGKPGIQERVQT